MKRFKQLLYVFAFIGFTGLVYVYAFKRGYDTGYDNGIKDIRSTIVYENLVPESVKQLEKWEQQNH